MAIIDYSSLQDTVADWLHRTDLAVQIPTFIQLAESKISNNIRSRHLETKTDLITAAGIDYVALPTDYGSLKNIQVSGATNTVLTLLPDDTLLNYNANNDIGIPRFYSIQGENIMLSPIPNGELTLNLVYYKDLTPLSGVNTTNWVLNKYPAVYLYGALIEASVYINDPEQVQFYQMKFDQTIEDMWRNFGYESFSGSPLRATSDYIV
ncbi:phage adaptor protein [Methylobacter sp. YRD-M1]|uniref:phage adaptor protein n=1 Tax=Methylobacter sp. YRD-M1 TaxID=2911520 RepID=UPI00227CE2BB|nr:hypothetical protein [Methylobacter sp. YRD-M1]WAK01868.1 hypothetical protein LZ558_18945 [Methylobacter sp. YRD-M1]